MYWESKNLGEESNMRRVRDNDEIVDILLFYVLGRRV